jgi:hypothetical protein
LTRDSHVPSETRHWASPYYGTRGLLAAAVPGDLPDLASRRTQIVRRRENAGARGSERVGSSSERATTRPAHVEMQREQLETTDASCPSANGERLSDSARQLGASCHSPTPGREYAVLSHSIPSFKSEVRMNTAPACVRVSFGP